MSHGREVGVLGVALALAGCGAAPEVPTGEPPGRHVVAPDGAAPEAPTRGSAGRQVVARDGAGERVAHASLPASGRFALAYRHSYFRAPAEERFRALDGDAFALEAIASPHAGVLDYYELEGPRTREGGEWVLRPAVPPRFERLALAGTPTGRRTLVAGAARLPLWGEDGGVRHVEIGVEGS